MPLNDPLPTPLVFLSEFALLFDDSHRGTAHLCHPHQKAGFDPDDDPLFVNIAPSWSESLCGRHLHYAALGWRPAVHKLCVSCLDRARTQLGIDVRADLARMGLTLPDPPFAVSFMPGATPSSRATWRIACAHCSVVYRASAYADLLRQKHLAIAEEFSGALSRGAFNESVSKVRILVMTASPVTDTWWLHCACGHVGEMSRMDFEEARQEGLALAFSSPCPTCGVRRCVACTDIETAYGPIQSTEPLPPFLSQLVVVSGVS